MYTQYGVREICDVVFKAKANMTVGNRKFFKGEPVIYFDTLKTSTLEGAATTVYASGGRGNSRLVAWESERTVTFTMEDALISPVGFMLLSGAGLVEASGEVKTATIASRTYYLKNMVDNKLIISEAENMPLYDSIKIASNTKFKMKEQDSSNGIPFTDLIPIKAQGKTIYADLSKTEIIPEGASQFLIEGDGITYQYLDTSPKLIYQHITETIEKKDVVNSNIIPVNKVVASQEQHPGSLIYVMPLKDGRMFTEPFLGSGDGNTRQITIKGSNKDEQSALIAGSYIPIGLASTMSYVATSWEDKFKEADAFLVDYYTPHYKEAMQIDITPNSFGGNFYIEASTLFKDVDGVDHPAEFIIPNAKIQSNFTFNMASSGDPSTFTFTCDAFPDYTRFNRTKKVIASLQIITGDNSEVAYRKSTNEED